MVSELERVADRLRSAYRKRDEELRGSNHQLREVVVRSGDARELLQQLPTATVDLVVTSPPYFGICDYTKAQRLSLEWMSQNIEPLRLQEIGARSKRHRQTAADEYLAEMREVLAEMHRSLRRGGHLALIVGESGSRQSVLADVRAIMTRVGFSLTLDIERRVSAQRRQTPSVNMEFIIVASKK